MARRKRFLAILLCLLTFAFCGCDANKEDLKQKCVDAVECLRSQTEYHYVSYTKEGSSLDELSLVGTFEYWISSNAWMYCDQTNSPLRLWKLSVDDTMFQAIEMNGTFEWRPAEGLSKPASPVPSEDLSEYIVESDNINEGHRSITLLNDDSVVNENITISNFRLTFTFDENDTLQNIEYSYTTEISTENGNIQTFITVAGKNFFVHSDGGVFEVIQNRYLEVSSKE